MLISLRIVCLFGSVVLRVLSGSHSIRRSWETCYSQMLLIRILGAVDRNLNFVKFLRLRANCENRWSKLPLCILKQEIKHSLANVPFSPWKSSLNHIWGVDLVNKIPFGDGQSFIQLSISWFSTRWSRTSYFISQLPQIVMHQYPRSKFWPIKISYLRSLMWFQVTYFQNSVLCKMENICRPCPL